jgi:soluble P-type ATPase/hemerythrin-like domain-containing protein
LAEVEVLLLDKTGTLTVGRPTVLEVVPVGGHTAAEILTIAASLDQVSPHVLATAIVRSARERGLSLSLPDDVAEEQGQGIRGVVAGRTVAVGKAVWVVGGRDPAWARSIRRRADLDAAITVFVAIDGEPAGGILLEDPIRADAARTVRELRRDGIQRAVMVSGDRADVAESVGAVIGLDAVMAERSPADKVEAVRLERAYGTTIMVGDGINDAPALAAADVGVAMGARGATASSQTADVVLVVDRLARLGEAMQIARRARGIARQSALAGISLSAVAMAVAAAGYLPPTWGAIAQEGIDVAVIVNSLRVLRGGTRERLPDADLELTRRFMAEHRTLRPDVDQLRDAADALAAAPDATTMAFVRSVHEFLRDELAPHEEAEDAELYPMMARVMGGDDPTGTMSRAHVEIAHLIRRLGRVLENVDPTRPDDEDVRELRRLLYGLHAVLKLHFAQEDEGYLSLVDEVSDT